MNYLKKMTITFDTYNDDRNNDTVLHVFVKNRKNDTSTPERATDYISNHLAYQRHEDDYHAGYRDRNPYLGYAEAIAKGSTLHDHSTNTFDIPLRSEPISCEELILPVINIHILPNLEDRWEFDYAINFFFDDGTVFSATSKTDGRTGIILDEHTLNYSGICQENPYNLQPLPEKYQTYALITLTGICL